RKLGANVARDLRIFCNSQSVTVFSFFQLSLSILLSRYSNTHDIVMGTPMANRPLQELTEVVGYFVNTVALRTELQSQQSFTIALKHQHNRLLDVMEKQNVPFGHVVEHIVGKRIEGVSPLVQIMFVLQNNDIPDLRLGDARIEVETPKVEWMDLDLNIEVIEQNGEITVNWTYAQSLFSASMIDAMVVHFERLLSAVLANPDAPIQDIELLTSQQINHLLYDFNDTQTAYAKDLCIHQLFEQQAALNPDNVAVVYEQNQLTYQQLNHKANQLAHYLQQHHFLHDKAKPDILIGLCVDRSLEMVIGIMAILKAGGAYVPLDPSYPQDRLNYMFEDAALDVVLSQTHLQNLLGGFNGTLLALDGLGEGDDHFCMKYDSNNPVSVKSSNLAYMIYTSGSTGKPKGVMVEHQALFNRIHWMHNKYGLNADDKVLQKTPYSFDVSVWEFVWT
ncbi:MAG: AMP-binding protein, partial [Psychrosphaera sp.]|nr:AMP-binding protein [Psychrosphaera sp.]